jgi:phospholipid/cholesterol/gamma-HCH transport system substrate-binding protein
VRRAIREHLTDFVAIGVLLVAGLAITLFILSSQQAPYPSWLPVLGDDTVELRGEFRSAQAVTPGQGQTVNIAGIKVGDISEAEIEDGNAVVTMLVEEEYAALIRSDATMLLRPRTGLQDMVVELDPGSEGEPVADGATIPVTQTESQVQSDQVLASLDGDTRAYLQLLLEGGGRGLGGNGEELAAVLKRFEPTARDLAKINGKLSQRRNNIARSINSFRRLSAELGSKDTQLGEFVDSSNAVMESFANQEASLRGTLQELPSALAATRGALESGDRLALELGPASEALIPSAEALGPALRETRPFFRDTVAPIRDQIRPFTRQVQTPVRHLTQAAVALNDATPAIDRSFTELNSLFNSLAFNPSGAEEGYLFWSSWFAHNTNGLFTLQDAQGPLLRGLVLQSCGTAANAEALTNSVTSPRPFLKTLQQLTRVPTANDPPPYDPTQPFICDPALNP